MSLQQLFQMQNLMVAWSHMIKSSWPVIQSGNVTFIDHHDMSEKIINIALRAWLIFFSDMSLRSIKVTLPSNSGHN